MEITGTFLRSYVTENKCIEGMITLNVLMNSENQPEQLLDIITVIDESQSMVDNINIVKKILHFLVEKATPNIHFGIVGFSNEAIVKCELSEINQNMHTYIETLQVDSLTNLYDGLNVATKMLKKGRDNALPIIFLITDGVANVGTTDPVIIKQRLGINIPSIFSLSIGTDCNHDLLASLAELTNAKTFRIKTIDEIASSAGALLGSVLSLRFKNVKVSFPNNVCNISGLYNIGNMFAGEVIHIPFQSESLHVGIFKVYSDDKIFGEIELSTLENTENCEDNQDVKVQILRCKIAKALLHNKKQDLVQLQEELKYVCTNIPLVTLLRQRILNGLTLKQTEETKSINNLELIRQSSQSSEDDHPQSLPLMRCFSREATQFCEDNRQVVKQPMTQVCHDNSIDCVFPDLPKLTLKRY